MNITCVARPYLITFVSSGHTYPLTSEDAQRLLSEYPAVRATHNRVVLQGHNTGKASERTILRPATVGGGPAFIIGKLRGICGDCDQTCDRCTCLADAGI